MRHPTPAEDTTIFQDDNIAQQSPLCTALCLLFHQSPANTSYYDALQDPDGSNNRYHHPHHPKQTDDQSLQDLLPDDHASPHSSDNHSTTSTLGHTPTTYPANFVTHSSLECKETPLATTEQVPPTPKTTNTSASPQGARKIS
ncbi:hypothetical protein ACA910_014242 [Epithemia clementina (nom. ined.)]